MTEIISSVRNLELRSLGGKECKAVALPIACVELSEQGNVAKLHLGISCGCI